MAQNLQHSHGLFPMRSKRRPLTNHITCIVIVVTTLSASVVNNCYATRLRSRKASGVIIPVWFQVERKCPSVLAGLQENLS